MMLTITIRQGPATDSQRTRTLVSGDLSIGRGPENDWVLPDATRILSKRHCILSDRPGSWHIADMSSNGTFLNEAAEPIGTGRIQRLEDGDRIRLGPYEMELHIAAESRPRPEPASPFMENGGLGGSDEATLTALPAGVSLPPRPAPAAAAAPAADVASDNALLAAFLRGAGLESATVPDPVAAMERIGAAFREAVFGIRQTLLARSAVKSEFRIEQTMIRARGNNPLKFSTSDEDALASMVMGDRRSDMLAPQAMIDALRDIRLHELATMAAMQTAVRALLKQLDPAPLREEGEKAGGMIPAQRRARAFELYERLHAEIGLALADDFDAVFGRTFAEAYERALHEASSQEMT